MAVIGRLFGLIGLACFSVLANQDTNQRLEQRDAISAQQTEQKILAEEKKKDQPGILQIDLEQILKSDDVNQVAQALYQVIKARQWQLAKPLLDKYQLMPNADVMLIAYANGAVARANNELDIAEDYFTQLVSIQPNFILGQLELARVLFENKKNTDSLQLFTDIEQRLPIDVNKTAGVRETIQSYQTALEHRDSWQGALSFGAIYNDNLNRSSESYTCFLYLPTGQCVMERVVPDAISATGFDYDASLNKRFSLSGQHGVNVKALAYGSIFNNYTAFNEHTVQTSVGYSLHAPSYQLSLAPQFEFTSVANHALSVSHGLKLDWFYNLSQRSAMRVEIESEYQNYRRNELDYLSDWQHSMYATYWYQWSPQWLIFSGLDYSIKENAQQVHEYTKQGVRLGVSWRLDDVVDASLFASWRQKKHQDYSALLEAQREDIEQNYTLLISLPKWQIASMTPVITVEHNRTRSNVDWLYSYQQNQIGVKLEKRF